MEKYGWDVSAEAWIAEQGEAGDFGRRHVLDGPLLERIDAGGWREALDVGCGEGRFCRLLAERGVRAVGLDPTKRLLEEARRRDPAGTYVEGRAEAAPFADGAFDLVVAYLTLIDIEDYRAAIREASRVLRPGGGFLIANLTSFNTAGQPRGWSPGADGALTFEIDDYLEERAIRSAWRDMRVVNHHRPLSAYMKALLAAGLQLRWFDEPAPAGGDPATAARHRRAPYFLAMEWRKPENGGKAP
ncbi:MAG: class I SAM-dependent methyltransferase [Pseudomonadota bacterium]